MKGLDFGVVVVISVMVTSYFSGCSVDVYDGDDDDDGCCSLAGVVTMSFTWCFRYSSKSRMEKETCLGSLCLVFTFHTTKNPAIYSLTSILAYK